MAYVWAWLPGEVMPVVAGVIEQTSASILFMYGRSYLARSNAVPLYDPELPLKPGWQPLLSGQLIPGCIRDAGPDSWGRKVIINAALSFPESSLGFRTDFSELEYLLLSGSDRIGNLDFQVSATEYVPRYSQNTSLTELQEAADCVANGQLLPRQFATFHYATAVGGARPKALVELDGRKYIAKFSDSSDQYNVVKAEYMAMRLAQLCGLSVAPVRLEKAQGQDILLIERFDRYKTEAGWCRKGVVSALTMMGLDDARAENGSYAHFADILRTRATSPRKSLQELYSRLVFSILSGNNDDHARNHAAFWDGYQLTLTPAYDICPQTRAGQEARQGMLIVGRNNLSQLRVAIEFARAKCNLSPAVARQIILQQLTTIESHWRQVCEEASLSVSQQNRLWGQAFLNPFVFSGLEGDASSIGARADEIRQKLSG